MTLKVTDNQYGQFDFFTYRCFFQFHFNSIDNSLSSFS